MSKSLTFCLLLIPLSLHAANRDADYEQVRRIAQRDPKVRAAYEAADRKLAERIVEIDPTLRGYRPGQPASKAKAPAPKPTPAPRLRGAKHKVAPGETFESIAAQYRVGVPTLKQANPGVQERRLQVGQALIVPKKNTTPSTSKSKPAAKEKSWWEQLAE